MRVGLPFRPGFRAMNIAAWLLEFKVCAVPGGRLTQAMGDLAVPPLRQPSMQAHPALVNLVSGDEGSIVSPGGPDV
jgi:hypothetical protein